MKKIYLFLFLLIIVAQTQAQTIFNTKEKVSRTITDPRAIFLTNGFSVSAKDANPFVAKINPNTTVTSDDTKNSTAGSSNPSGEIVGTSKFHDTKGDISVDGGGQLNFSLPIALPPSINGVAPQMNLVYTSSTGAGIAGMGFSLTGITNISRTIKNIENDGKSEALQLDYSDYYSFGGQRLLLKDATNPTIYGKDGTEYVTENYSTIKIKSIGTISGQAYKGPEYFEVTFDNGAQAWYGTTLDSKTPVEYNLVKWKDAQGNYITYTYTKNNNVSLISFVAWGGNETSGEKHFNSIEFNYTSRDFKEVSYINNMKFMQDKILSNIVVNANGSQFKKYIIDYKKDTNETNYQYLDNITEYNSENQAANPVVFNYEQSISGGWSRKNFVDNESDKKVGDFDGDGLIDYIKHFGDRLKFFKSYLDNSNNVSDVLFTPTASIQSSDFYSATPISFKNSANQISARQGILIKKEISDPLQPSIKTVEFVVYSIQNNELKFEFKKAIATDILYPQGRADYITNNGDDDYDNEEYITKVNNELRFTSSDLDGDGISEIILNRIITVSNHAPDKDRQTQISNSTDSFVKNFILNLDPNVSDEESISEIDMGGTKMIYSSNNQLIGDFSGNGKISFLETLPGEKYIHNVSFVKSNVTQKFTMNTSASTLNTFKGLIGGAITGDFNGDKKTDLLIPVGKESSDWYLYISTGNGFKEEYKSNLAYWRPSFVYENKCGFFDFNCQKYTDTETQSFKAIDIDKDGKAELVGFIFNTVQYNGGTQDYARINLKVYKNIGASSTSDVNLRMITNSALNFSGFAYNPYNRRASIESNGITDFGLYSFSEMVGDFTISNMNSNIVILGKDLLNKNNGLMYTLNVFDSPKMARINSITQGGITTNVSYKELDNQKDAEFYNSTQKEQYPFVELDRVSQSFVVSQLSQLERKQDFKYRGLIANVNGRGMIGFRKTARSNWYANGFESTKVWSGVEIDPLNNGLKIKEWATRQDNDVFPTDLSVNNTALLSYSQFGYAPKVVLPNGVRVLVPELSIDKNFLTNTTKTSQIEYDNYYLPSKITTSINNLSTTESKTDYLLGRVVQKEETVTAYGDTKKSKAVFTYKNNLPETKKTYNQDYSHYILETYVYDVFGNVLEKTISNSIDNQTTKVKNQYDTKGLYVLKTTNNIGLESQTTYNNWGQVLTQTDPLGNTTTNTYDGWGKQLTTKTNLAGTTTFTYKKEGDDIVTTQYDPTGDTKQTRTNKLGQQYLVMSKGFDIGSYVYKKVEYDLVGRKTKESEPYYISDSPQWNTIVYDDNFFPAKVTATSFNGKIVETQAQGLTTIAKELNGYNRTTRKTTDALGNIIESEDKGGIIKFTYNALGQNLTATYGTNVVTTQYDLWGRKESFMDPSNGLYKYEYDGFGQLKKETSPKGEKTFTFNSLGQLIGQTEVSKDDNAKATNKSISFIYDNKGRITDKTGTANGKTYSSNITYDANGRIVATAENSNGKFFYQKNITYNNTGQVSSYEKGLLSSGILTQTSIQKNYDSWAGNLYQLQDKNTSKILWQLQETKANGQVIKAKLGEVTISNTYDSNNFLSNTKHTSAIQPNLLQMTYDFDAIKNELKTRSRRGIITTTEVFTYENNNRLQTWTNPKTGQLSSNIYDEKGRILTNDQIGTTTFDQTKIYQAKIQELNPAGIANYTNNNPLLITYNENNDPVYINGQKGDALFSYGLTEMRQMVTYGGNFNPDLNQKGKFTKYYSQDGSYEITQDNTTGQEKHILYLEGTPYQSDIIYLKNYNDTTAKYLYLHKDYIGSILAITNETGNSLEQHHYDAWGVITHNVNTAGQPIANGSWLIDRGYTSHEHFEELGIIHMNGRLYDPLQRRFLNADENIQDPYNTQNYNKYGYVMNNPLMYNDPSGEFLFVPLLVAVAIGAAVGVATYLVATRLATGSWEGVTLCGTLKAAFWGAVSGAVTFGIGSAFSSTANGVITGASKFAKSLGDAAFLVKAAAHGVAQGLLAMVQNGGAGFLSGAAAGFFGDLGATAWGGDKAIGGNSGGIAGKYASSTVGTIAFGAISGGIGAELTGGNFWQGAVTGGIVSGLNHAMHQMGNEGDGEDPPKYKYKNKFYEDKAKLYGDILLDQAAEQFGIKDILALGAAVDNMGYLSKPFVMEGASTGTSFASKYGAKLLPQKMPVRMFTHVNKAGSAIFTKTLGRFLGRALGPIGWAMLTYDVGMTFYNTQQIYNKIVQ